VDSAKNLYIVWLSVHVNRAANVLGYGIH